VRDVPVQVGAVQRGEVVVLAARAAGDEAAREGLARWRFALGVDEDHREFYDRFAGDRYIGRAVRERPHVRVWRRPDPWEALAWAVTEQLIEFHRAVRIQRRLIGAYGRRCPDTGLRDAPAAAVVAREAPAALAAFDLPQHRASALRRAAVEVARGRVDLAAPEHEAGWRRLRAIPGIGAWTIEMLALTGQGRYDQVPAADLGYLKLIGRLMTGNPRARCDEAESRGFFERYGAWKGLAGEYLRISASYGLSAV
jgi:3-methyladenine DNA glycosylase/8-oxoguanine DNA glycosylase